MAVKKQPDSGTGELSETVNDWLRQFLKQLELFMVDTGQRLSPISEPADYHLAAMQAVRLTFLDSGMDDEELRNLFGRVAIENISPAKPLQWNADLNSETAAPSLDF
jgi:hypothetical protein